MLSQSNAFTLFAHCFIDCIVSSYANISVENRGKTTQYEVQGNETIKELKKKVCKEDNIDVDNVDLVLHGKRLENDETLFQIAVDQFEDAPVLSRFKRWRAGASGRKEIPVLQVVNR